ncbi:hypothetical protein BU24DRAFT_402604 [Aaosphaeria arxii CBS 175.79]|uniref:Lipid droplet-associated hydrolase n=1 Tax=Aaosphaeria arxii CBS 175.79 TaxID=1450172 RepID=A0A6A5X7C1_9PLEO|nr:uncharacterized protein BU24DRAFT_402604 [Aaosphaeria arxii CBS 175.79]KAF2008809.1 hypothetical protein BU24DRAFT_402604 [Aaosphaeria arxii CBS 175.79]
MTPPPPTSIHLSLASSPSSEPKITYILYFVPGNPGLVGYYTLFLTHLFSLLTSASPANVAFEVHGRSLAGFECTSNEDEGKAKGKGPFTVKEQVAFAAGDVRRVVRDVKARRKGDVKVVLMGHSLGTYMCLELIRHFSVSHSTKCGREQGGVDGEVDVAGGVLLFATIQHLALSPRGIKASPLLLTPPLGVDLAVVLGWVARVLFGLVPVGMVAALVGWVMGFPADAARTTAGFLKSKGGVRQALFMARDEMVEIGEDKWGEEVWGAVSATAGKRKGGPVLKFLFAREDHWIADEVRDGIIKARGRKMVRRREVVDDGVEVVVDEWKPEMEVDEVEGWTHDFCIRDSVSVARRAMEYIEDIVERDMSR